MGAVAQSDGVSFRVWAPNAQKVSVIGSFNDWDPQRHPLESDGAGSWQGQVRQAAVGDEYRFWLRTGEHELRRIDPYAREVSPGAGNGIIHDSSFDWEGDAYELPVMNEMVIYELHIGTFADHGGDGAGDFCSAERRLEHLQKLGVNCIEIMPIAEVPDNRSWGYDPAHIFSVENSYGGARALKSFVKKCHSLGIGVILDVVYNHMGPFGLDLWRFDGWYENEAGGIYFYQDHRAETPWGHTRPDYGRPEVRQFLCDNARMWLEEYHFDGLRYDSTVYMRMVDGKTVEIPEAWSLFQELNGEVRRRFPRKVLIAEDLQGLPQVTGSIETGGAGFHSQWCARFVHPIRKAVIEINDEQRDLNDIAAAIRHCYNGDFCQRVIYSESHDEVANGHRRVTSEVLPHDPQSHLARKRATLAACVVFSSPGIPMLFQGQEFLETGWFQDNVPLDWDLSEEFSGIVRLYRDLIKLRLNRAGNTRGLTGQNVFIHHLDHDKKVIAYLRRHSQGVGDDVLVVANFSNLCVSGYRIGFPAEGMWRARFHSDWKRYDGEFQSEPADVRAGAQHWNDMPASAELEIPGYSLLMFSQDR